MSRFWHKKKGNIFRAVKKKKPPCLWWQGGFGSSFVLTPGQPHDPLHDPQLPPLLSGLAEVMENPDR